MEYLKFGAEFLIAEFVSVLGLSQIFVALRTAFPFTKYLEAKYGGIDAKTIRKRAGITVAIWLVILCGIACGLVLWGDRMVMAGAGCAFVLALLLSWPKSKPGPQPIEDYFNAYRSLISDETMQQYAKDVLGTML